MTKHGLIKVTSFEPLKSFSHILHFFPILEIRTLIAVPLLVNIKVLSPTKFFMFCEDR